MSWWDMFYQQLANGLVLGSVYVLVAVGFTLCLGVLKLINVAQGHLLMLGAFMTFQFSQGWFDNVGVLNNYFVCILLSVLFVSVVGAGIHIVGIKPVHGKSQVAPILTTVALAFFIENIARKAWPGEARTLNTSLSDNYRNPIGQIFLTDQKVLTFFAALLLVLVLYLFLQRTQLGKALRATTQNETAASLMGISPQFMFLVAMMIAAALAAAGGGFLAPIYPIETTIGMPYLFKAMIVVLLGGLGNIGGAIAGGLLLGLMESMVGGLWDAAWVNVVVFGTIIVVLIVRPAGLLGGKGI
ncbi:MAG: branched-chain amino acid ABC transporter permease [Dehalococcoidia bacterium]|nr:branched-chain amino acid ABC transporter permease [Dehalococcoidia bacterium]